MPRTLSTRYRTGNAVLAVDKLDKAVSRIESLQCPATRARAASVVWWDNCHHRKARPQLDRIQALRDVTKAQTWANAADRDVINALRFAGYSNSVAIRRGTSPKSFD